MKINSAICALAITAASLTFTGATASAAERPTSVAGCAKPTSKAHEPATVKQPSAPDKKLAKTMTIKTNCGVITIDLNPAAAQTVTNLSTLARSKYFDGTFCHRLTTEGIYVLQCGDPSAQGNGSPGTWKGYKDENLPTKTILTYPAGTVAMANSGPGTNGSQFFLVFADTSLGPDYTIWGKITKGLDIVQAIAKAGVKGGGGDGTPNTTIALTKVRVS